jgi:hypothetical protein
MTLDSSFSHQIFFRVPKQTSGSILPKGMLALPGTIPWKEQSVGFKNLSEMFIARRVHA